VFTFIESAVFERLCALYLDDDEYAELQQFMMETPEAGQVVPGSGGALETQGYGQTRRPARDLLRALSTR
jgi:hypothetical protein